MARLPKCNERDGKRCLFMRSKTGCCYALSNTDFKGKPCPFFKDMDRLSQREIYDYRSLKWVRKAEREGEKHDDLTGP